MSRLVVPLHFGGDSVVRNSFVADLAGNGAPCIPAGSLGGMVGGSGSVAGLADAEVC